MMDVMLPIWISLACAAAGMAYAFFMSLRIAKADAGTERMKEVAAAIREGAMAFISRQYRVVAVFVLAFAAIFALVNTGALRFIAVAFITGAFCSALAGLIGMHVATKANVRTANAARTGLGAALKIAFRGGSVMGLSVVGLGLLGLGGLFIIFANALGLSPDALGDGVLPILIGFSFGASLMALFARVAGGIYTKAADVGADLVGKVEKGIPEDDPRNAATIADNVGDNVGDVCGMGADLFESYIGALISAMVLGVASGIKGMELPIALAAAGILASILGTLTVRVREGGNPQRAFNVGTIIAAALYLLGSYFVIVWLAPAGLLADGAVISAQRIWIASTSGLVCGVLVGLITVYYCSKGSHPVGEIVAGAGTGAGTNVIAGLAVGMRSTALPVVTIAAAIIFSYYIADLYGIAIAALGMLSTTGIQLAVDAYGPVADNAGGIAEMSGLPPEVRERTDTLDAVGNTTAAIGKGFAIGSAALTALALFTAFRKQAGIAYLDLTSPHVMAGMLIGGMMPFLFSSFALKAVGQTARFLIDEVRRQFHEIPGIMEGTAKPDYARCVDISAKAAIRRMLVPGLAAVVVPVTVGVLSELVWHDLGALGGLLAGVIVSGVMMAIFMANAGGAWDNAKKQIESEPRDPQKGTGKGSARHAAAVIGDTVGDPFKDTAGPSLNILIKAMCVLSLLLIPLFAKLA